MMRNRGLLLLGALMGLLLASNSGAKELATIASVGQWQERVVLQTEYGDIDRDGIADKM